MLYLNIHIVISQPHWSPSLGEVRFEEEEENTFEVAKGNALI